MIDLGTTATKGLIPRVKGHAVLQLQGKDLTKIAKCIYQC